MRNCTFFRQKKFIFSANYLAKRNANMRFVPQREMVKKL